MVEISGVELYARFFIVLKCHKQGDKNDADKRKGK